MIKHHEIEDRIIAHESGPKQSSGEIRLKYYLVESTEIKQLCIQEYLDAHEASYGIRIDGRFGGDMESETVFDLSCDKEKAAKAVRLIVDGLVTPCTLRDVICDIADDII